MRDTIMGIIHDVLIVAIVTVIFNFCKILWLKINAPAMYKEKPEINLKKIRKQFLVSLFSLILSIIVLVNTQNQLLVAACIIVIFLSFTIVWGAFDAIYFPFEELKYRHSQNIANTANENHSDLQN